MLIIRLLVNQDVSLFGQILNLKHREIQVSSEALFNSLRMHNEEEHGSTDVTDLAILLDKRVVSATIGTTVITTSQGLFDLASPLPATGLSNAVPQNLGTAASGTGASGSRYDHVHGHGNLAGGSLHAAVIAGGAAGFMTGTDKSRLDGMADGATATPLSGSTPTDLGTAAPGDSTSASRANHVHGHGNLAGGALHADAIAGGASGFLPGSDKAKLDSLIPTQDIFYIGPLGNDTTGDGTEARPFATMQKAYDTWFPTGTPLTWAEFDRKRVFRILPGTTAAGAGDLVASCCNFVIEGFGTVGNVTYDVKAEVMATFTGASQNYEINTLYFRSGGFGWDTSGADSQLITGDVVVSNFNTVARALNLSFESCQAKMKTQARVVPGGFTCSIYIRATDTVFIYCESGVNALGDMPMTFSILRDCIFRNQVNATKGAIGFADMQGCYFRRGFVGDPGIASMVSTGAFRGWEVNHIKYAFDVSAYPQELRMDYPTWKYLKEEASPALGTCTVKLTDQFGGVTGSRPTGVLPAGMCYFDTTLGRPVWWSGAAWLGADGLAA